MPPPATPAELVEQVRRAGAARDSGFQRLPPAQWVRAATAEAAAGAMVGDGLITPYQAQRLLRGETRGLRIADRYRVLDRIGSGGMGQVYLCEDTTHGRPVAVKVLPATLGRDPEAAARFRREARAAAVLDHPAVVRVLDVGQDGPHSFLVLEFVDGADLYRYVTARGPLDPRAAAHYVARAAAALQRAADKGWVHRDVKPHNLMVDRAGKVRLLDLGLARPVTDDSRQMPVTDPEGSHSLLGTADFIAPEQTVNSSRVDGRADIYSLGATFYFLLAGRPPFPDGTTAQKLAWHRNRDPLPMRDLRADVPDGMAEVLRKMMAKDPAARPPTPAAVAGALALWSDPPPPPPDPAGLPDWPPAVRRVLGLPAGGAAATPAAATAPLPSSFARRAARAAEGTTHSLPGWVAVGSMAVGVVTAILLASRTPAGLPTAPNSGPPSAGAVGAGDRSRTVPGATDSGAAKSHPGR